MSKKQTPPAPLMTLDEISGMTAAAAADQFAARHQTRTHAFVEMGKFAYHLENNAKLKKNETLYGIMKAKGVPEGTVNNARRASKFITAFVVTGLVSEARFDEIITFRIANRAVKIIEGKSAVQMPATELSELLNKGEKSAIGAELDSLDEHGLTIAAREEEQAKAAADQKRIADAAAAAAKLPPQSISAAPSPTEPPSPEGEPETPEVETETAPEETPEVETETPAVTPPATEPEAAPNTVPITGTGKSSHNPQPSTLAEILAEISAAELKSFDLETQEMETVCVKLGEWIELLAAHMQNAKKPAEKAA